MNIVLGASMTAAALLAAAPAPAQSAGYLAVPESAPTRTNVMTRTTLWKCAGVSCTALRSDERDAVLCRLVAKQLGPLTTFAARGAAFGAEALAECNAAAR